MTESPFTDTDVFHTAPVRDDVDPRLGAEVHSHLTALGIETPFAMGSPVGLTAPSGPLSDGQGDIANLFREIMDRLGLNLWDDSLQSTPKRVAKMYCQEVFYGLNYHLFPKCTDIDNRMKYNEMIAHKVSVWSFCEHHFLPFVGTAHIGYIPDTKVIGLSKMNRIVDFFSRRPQVQERLTEQISAALRLILKTEDVAVVVQAEHFCVKLRGIQDQASITTTSRVDGKFRAVPEARAEFFSLTHAYNGNRSHA